MTQTGGQSGQPRVDVAAVAVPPEQRPDGQRVPEVMQPRRKGRVDADAGDLAQTSEGLLDRAGVEPCSAQRHEKALLMRAGHRSSRSRA